MHFNPEITIGTIVEVIVFISGLIAGIMHINRKFGEIQTKVNIMYHWFDTVVIRGVIIPSRPESRGEDVKRFFGDEGGKKAE
jgi:hypothetical protein